MKSIVLAAGPGNIHLKSDELIPKCLEDYNNDKKIIDIILESFKKEGIKDVNIVGGYQIEKIMNHRPEVKFFYNEKWEKTKSLYSLLKASSLFDSDLIISYSDIVFNSEVVSKLKKCKGSVGIAFDSLWTTRYEGRTESYLKEAEKLYETDNKLTVNKDGDVKEALGEFAGILIIRKSIAKKLKNIIENLLDNGVYTIPGLITFLSSQDFHISTMDVKGHWAELDSSQDLYQFKFGTKAETLKSLENKLNNSIVLPQYSFVVGNYEKNCDNIISSIISTFDSKSLVVRSSALNEDTENSSMAGNYESILNIPANDSNKIKEAIEVVRDSYLKGGQTQDSGNQILVQPMLENVSMSGVLFTKDLETSAPYYTINYDLSGSTESITAGEKGEHHTLVYFKEAQSLPEDVRITKLIKAIKEIEDHTGYTSLDIEFAFANDSLYILQVRPIAAHKDSLRVSSGDIVNELKSIKSYIKEDREKSFKLTGTKVAYGVMPDWNPAEIIGVSPKPLSFSLYKEIITDLIWPISRMQCGYRDTTGHPGIISFSGKPYVDIRMSFNSFTPVTLDDELSAKLINFYIDKLNDAPHLHDKVEFNVAITAYDLTLDDRLEELKANGFNSEEIKKIKSAFLELTNTIINEQGLEVKEEIDKTISLEKIRKEVNSSSINPIKKAGILIESTKELGTIPFSNLARFGFIGAIILKSLRAKGIIDNTFYDNFFKSVHTVAKEFVTDLSILDRDKLIEKYGHLRPGTYEISSPAYHENFDNYITINSDEKNEELTDFTITPELNSKLNIILKDHGLEFDTTRLFDFIREATEARELAKFEFTKNLSMALDYISEFVSEYGISREEAAYLTYNDLKKYIEGSISSNISDELHSIIDYNKSKHLITSAIKLPELILSEKDVDYFYLSQSQPNFVTQKQITGEIVVLKDKVVDINDKIVCIENADPGFDWIFSHNIKALITKYGGTNSHMAIRCAEFELPAAIGCGDSIYNSIKDGNRIYLDALGKKIEVLS